MARIAFFTESLPPAGDVIGRFAWDLIYSLADQQHDIRVFSTYVSERQELPASHSRIEIVRPFRRWGITELPKIVPSLLAFRPEVMHVIQPHREALRGLTNAMELLPAMKPVLGKPAFVASFFDVSESNLKRHRVLLSQLDAITVSNREQRDLFTSYYSTGVKQPLLEVVPLGFAKNERVASGLPGEILIIEDATSENEQLSKLKKTYSSVIAVGGPVESHADPLLSFSAIASALKHNAKSCAVILGGWGPLPIRLRHACEQILFDNDVAGRVLLTGTLNEDEEAWILSEADLVFAAPLSEARLAFTQFVRNAQKAGRAMILSHAQADLDPIRWIDGENAVVCESAVSSMTIALTQLLQDPATQDRLMRNLAEFSRTQVSDQPGNLVSRLYVKALTST